MGPGSKIPRETSPVDPPFFSPTADLREWRKKVRKWIDLIKAAHDSGHDRSYHTFLKILGQTIYTRGLPREQQAIVDEAQTKGTIDYTQTDDPVEAVHEIIKIVAVDPPIAAVTRLITSFNRVTSCRRKTSEEIAVFVSRFRGLAATHLDHASASPSSQIGQVLAIKLLNNANLDENTLTQCKLQLIALAEARGSSSNAKEKVLVNKNNLQELKELLNEIPVADVPGSSAAQRLTVLQNFTASCNSFFDLIKEKVEDIAPSNHNPARSSAADIFLSHAHTAELHLDDAVTVVVQL